MVLKMGEKISLLVVFKMVLNSVLKNGVKKKKKKAKKGYVFYSIGKPICVINGIISIKRQVLKCVACN